MSWYLWVAIGAAVVVFVGLAAMRRMRRSVHPFLLAARHQYAASSFNDGRPDDAIFAFEQLLTDSEQHLGSDHFSTTTARSGLAAAYIQAGRVDEAITLYEQLLTGREVEDPETFVVRIHHALACLKAGRPDAVANLEQVVADCERLTGPELHHKVAALSARGTLADQYWEAGRINDAVSDLESVLIDSEQQLGPLHPMTVIWQDQLRQWKA